jgi:hypothetical protein
MKTKCLIFSNPGGILAEPVDVGVEEIVGLGAGLIGVAVVADGRVGAAEASGGAVTADGDGETFEVQAINPRVAARITIISATVGLLFIGFNIFRSPPGDNFSVANICSVLLLNYNAGVLFSLH